MLRHASAGNTHVGSHRYSSHHVLPCTPGPRAIRAYYVSNRRAARCRAVQAFQHAGLHSPQAGRAAAATSKSPSPHTPCRLAFPFFTEPLTEETLSQLARGLHIQDSPENLCERMALGRAVAGIQAACREMHHAGQLAWSVEGVLRSGMVSGGTGVTGEYFIILYHLRNCIVMCERHVAVMAVCPLHSCNAHAVRSLKATWDHGTNSKWHAPTPWQNVFPQPSRTLCSLTMVIQAQYALAAAPATYGDLGHTNLLIWQAK